MLEIDQTTLMGVSKVNERRALLLSRGASGIDA